MGVSDDNKNIETVEEKTKSAYRAVSGDIQGDVSFGGGALSFVPGQKRLIQKNKKMTARLPAPHPHETLDKQNHIRGCADSIALYRKYHNDDIPNGLNDGEARDLFNMLEQARVESLGARQMDGVGKNIAAALEHACVKKQYHKNESPIPMEDSFYALTFQKLSGKKIGKVTTHVAQQIEQHVEQKLGHSAFDTLITHIDDQKTFAKLSERLIRQWMGMDMPSDDDEASGTENEETQPNIDNNDESNPQDTQSQGSDDAQEENTDDGHTQAESELDQDKKSQGDDSIQQGMDDLDDGSSDADHGGEQNAPRDTPPHYQNDPFTQRDSDYQIFTTDYDEVIEPLDLTSKDELKQLRAQLDDQLHPMRALIGKLANRLQRLLMAQQQRHWQFDVEEGILNTSRLARIIADPNLPVTYKQEVQTHFRDTTLTLLIDNSGSMRGRPITVAALSADILIKTLERVGVKVEVLGFTTANWKGGQSRGLWTQQSRPPMPGRLNDIRHIIYKQADTPMRRVRDHLGLMLKEGILKENIDGEALHWAYRRLQNRPEERKILMVISDGAPVDDSTLSANKSGYLETDLHRIIKIIEDRGDVELTAIGIGHDVGRYYKRAITIRNAADLPPVMMNELADLFAE